MARSTPTIWDVAKEAGVSIATVSFVLNGHGDRNRISADTQEHVRQVAERLGYVADRRAQSLRSRRAMNGIAVVFVATRVPTDFFSEIMQSISDAAAREGWETQFHLMNPRKPQTLAWLRGMSKAFAGAILVGDMDEDVYRETKDLALPIVRVGADHPDTQKAVVRVDNFKAGRAVAGHLMALGHKRIAVLGPARWHAPLADRAEGVREALRAAGLEPVAVVSNGNPDAGTVEEILKAGSTATVCLYDQLALRFLRRAREAGVRIPAHMSLASFDDLEWAGELSPPLTTVHIPRLEMGEAAVGLLKRLIAGEKSLEPYVIEPQLIVRESTAPPSP